MRVFKYKSYRLIQKVFKGKVASKEDPGKAEKSVRFFHDDTFQSFYRRLAFSPDGEILAVPSGVFDVEGETSTTNCTHLFSTGDLSK